jgi:hypothetical protein
VYMWIASSSSVPHDTMQEHMAIYTRQTTDDQDVTSGINKK